MNTRSPTTTGLAALTLSRSSARHGKWKSTLPDFGSKPISPPRASTKHQQRAGVTGQFVGDAVADLARALVERHHAAAVALEAGEVVRVAPLGAAADLHDQQVVLDDRRAADAEEVLHDAEPVARVHLPE